MDHEGDRSNGNKGGDQDDNTNLSATKEPPRATNEYVLNFALFSFVGFVVFQTVFALIANSESMLADSEAMSVDAVTYLLNLGAERIKKRPYTKRELAMPVERRNYQRELRRLYLELVPPVISVAALIFVTIITLREALTTLTEDDEIAGEDDVSIPIMLLFSFSNLLLDVVNVTCFARADSTFGLDVVRRDNATISDSIREMNSSSSVEFYGIDEMTPLVLNSTDAADDSEDLPKPYGKVDNHHMGHLGNHNLVNLNMCSAWSHIFADTLRSVAVLIAAFIAFVIPSVPPKTADSVAAIAVSLIILGSLIPLLQGLVMTALKIYFFTH